MNALSEIIRQEIDREGIISFARFMELALYHPGHGYYERTAQTVGRTGDFYTSVSVGALFGELLAFQFAQWLETAGACQLVEAGAHDGSLAADTLNWLQVQRPNLWAALEYWIIEPSPRRQKQQTETLCQFASKVRWFDSWQSLPAAGVHGIIFSNELLDAMPVHRLGWDAKTREWFEWGVTWNGEGFVWGKMNLDAKRSDLSAMHWPETLRSALRAPQFLALLPDGFTTEVCPAAEAWWRQAAGVLCQGKLLTFDYGLTAEQFFTPDRSQGTLRAYYRHHVNSDLLLNAGEQDLTAHVNFTALQSAGESAGLRTAGLFSQPKFLTEIAEETWRMPGRFGEWTSARSRQFQTLTHPDHLGRSFHVLVQSR